MKWELFEDQRNSGDWRLEAEGPDGTTSIIIFIGEDAKALAEQVLSML